SAAPGPRSNVPLPQFLPRTAVCGRVRCQATAESDREASAALQPMRSAEMAQTGGFELRSPLPLQQSSGPRQGKRSEGDPESQAAAIRFGEPCEENRRVHARQNQDSRLPAVLPEGGIQRRRGTGIEIEP